MRKFLLLSFACILGRDPGFSQNMSFTCQTNLAISCGPPCITLNARFPDMRGLGTDYSFQNTTSTSACYPLTSPSTPGTSTALTIDDRYSAVIPITFNFPFYGIIRTSLVASTNGIISFDLSKANGISHYGILNNGGTLSATTGFPQNLPSALYDAALIMGPYHDLDPSVGTSPTQKIKYDIVGTAPTRQFILSFYKVPLFLTSCNGLFENTHQIILYESSGIIEVSVFDKQICTGWNQGRAMIGLQDDTKTKGIMAPTRTASDPPWGSIGMNETWRFIPTVGSPLYRGVQLLDATGAVVATGDTIRVDDHTFEWNFTNICAPANTTSLYVVKTTYARIDDPTQTFYALDTINVTRTNSLAGTTSTTPTTCGVSVGTITVTPSAGTPPYTYVLDGGTPQTAPGPNTFNNVSAGPHTVVVTDATGCTNTFNVVVPTTNTITATASTTATSCPLSSDGTITITPTTGTAPFSYSLDGGTPQASNIFTNVTAGPHTVNFVDVFGCTGTVVMTVAAGSTPLTATVNTTPTSCPTVADGTITVTPTSGSPAYLYRLDGGPQQPSNVFTNVAAGAHTVNVMDQYGCGGNFIVVVNQGPGLTSTINGGNPPCSNINNGTITINPTSGTGPYQYSLNGGPTQPSNVFTGLAPGSYTINFTDAIGCSGTNTINLTTNPAITSTATLASPLCNGVSNGSITLNASGGVPPYQYSINNGTTYQASPTFGGLPAGSYNFLVKDAAGCVFGFTYTLTEPAVVNAAAANGIASCANNDGTITVTANGGTPAYQYSINNGISYQASNVFLNMPVGSYNAIRVKDANGCIASANAVVTLNDTMRLELGTDSTICFGTNITLLPQTNAQTDTFRWTPAAGLNYDTAKNPIASPTDTTKYYLVAKWGICQRRDSITINILHKPIADAGRDTTICFKTNALLIGKASNLSGTVNYSWAPPDSLNTPNAATTIARIDTTRKFTLTVTDNYGCNFSVSDSVWVKMMPVLVVNAGNDTNAILGRPHQLLGSGGANYTWSPAGPLNNPFIANPLATLYNDTYFTVYVTDSIGCSASDGVFVKVYEGPNYYVPNAFTPNGDGLNDVFRPVPVGIQKTDYFRVYDRYGQLMFETNKWLEGWDGMFKGKKALAGTYVWVIKGTDKNGSVVEMKGTVILVR